MNDVIANNLMLPRVRSVTARADYQLELEFTSGEVGVYDCKPLLDFGVFRELRDETYFRQVYVVNGTIAWPHEQDICPDTVYLDSQRRAEATGPQRFRSLGGNIKDANPEGR
jgi:hypothetical protein